MRTLLILPLCAAAWGCAAADAPLSPVFGQAVASLQTQIVPYEPNPAPPEGSAQRGAAAIARYEKGEVKPLQTHATSDVKVSLVPYGK